MHRRKKACSPQDEHIAECKPIPGEDDQCACGCNAYGDWCMELNNPVKRRQANNRFSSRRRT